MAESGVLEIIGSLVLVVILYSGIVYLTVKVIKFAWTGDW